MGSRAENMRGEGFQGENLQYPELCCQVVIITTIVPPLMCLVGVVWVGNRLAHLRPILYVPLMSPIHQGRE